MPLQKLIDYLEENQIQFTRIIHSKAFTAQIIAHRAHISGNILAKTVILKTSNNNFIMTVIPANYQVDLKMISEIYGEPLELASEEEFQTLFPGCETGAMPPFGNLFDLPVYVSETLSCSDEIAFNAGNHKELLQLQCSDYKRLVNPKIASFSQKKHW